MEKFNIKLMIAIICGKQAAYRSLIDDHKADTTANGEKFLIRMKAKLELTNELLKEYDARK